MDFVAADVNVVAADVIVVAADVMDGATELSVEVEVGSAGVVSDGDRFISCTADDNGTVGRAVRCLSNWSVVDSCSTVSGFVDFSSSSSSFSTTANVASMYAKIKSPTMDLDKYQSICIT